MALSAIECPNGVCHSHHGGHAVQREQLRASLRAHGHSWCERLAERVYEISVDSFSQAVMPHLHQDGWQRRHLDWEFKLQGEPAEVERTLVDGALNAVESFLHSSEVQRLFVQELVRGTVAESESDPLSRQGVRQLIEQELLALLQEQREALVDRVAEGLLEQADGIVCGALAHHALGRVARQLGELAAPHLTRAIELGRLQPVHRLRQVCIDTGEDGVEGHGFLRQM